MKKLLFSIPLFILFIISCQTGSKKTVTADAKFGNYVQAFTSGIISTESAISVYLAKPILQSDLSEKEIFKFSPEIKGEVVLVGNRIIEFRPSKSLQSGTTYNVEFLLGEIIEVKNDFRKMPFQFSTIEQSFSVTFDGLKNYESSVYTKMQFAGYLLTADVLNPAETEKLLTATFEGKEVEITWNHDTNRKKHLFTIDSLQRFEQEPAILKLQWNGRSLKIENEGEKIVEVPALNRFEIIETKVIQTPQQHVEIRFSDPLLKNQNLTGLVELDDGTDLRLEIDGNRIKAWPPGIISGEIKLSVFAGISNINYFKLKEPETFLLQFSNTKPEIRLIGKGVIVPQNKTLEMPFEAVGLNAVDIHIIRIFKNNVLQFFQDNNFQGSSELKKVGRLVYSGKIDLNEDSPGAFQKWNTYKVNLASLFEIEQGAIYRVEFRMKKEYAEYNCGETKVENTMVEAEMQTGDDYQTNWDKPGWYHDYYYPPGFDWDERDNPCHVSYYYSDRFVSRNIFASEFGIIAKEGRDHKMVFAVSNLLSTEAESGVCLNLYSFQNQLIESLETNGDGLAFVTLKKKPFFLVAQKGEQFGYLRLDDGTSLSTSNFNISGQEIKDGLKGFIYGERGVWRPGDTLFVNFILEKQSAELPENYPVVFRLINPNGQIIERQVHSENVNGFYSFHPKTASDAPTGNWQVEAKAGNVSFSKRIKIETVKPNRLKVELKIPKDVLTAKDSEIPLEASWLHGTPARSLKTKVDVLFVKSQTTFEGFEQFTFTNPGTNFAPQEQTIFEDRLDENGKTKIPLEFKALDNAPGMVKAWFTTRVFEEGGDFSINVTPAKYAPFKSFIGVKMPNSEDNWYKTDTSYAPEIVLVDANGKPTSGQHIEAKLYKINWRWWWESGSENLANYVSGRHYNPVLSWNIPNAKHLNKLKLNVKYINWQNNGRYLLWVKDLDSGHAAGTTFYMSKWGDWRSDDSAGGATLLTLHTDKEKYKVGDKIEVKIPSSKEGKALVSIENGTEVSDVFWAKTEEKQTSFFIDAKPEMVPNFYVHVSLIQKYGQTENDAPLRLYGITPVFVENPETILKPNVEVPEEIEPESEYTVRVSEQNNKKMTYTLAIVDEGLLGLTNFKIPNPHSAFYAREALGVKTWDLYDYVAGAYGAALEKAFAVGGDDDIADAGKKEVNRFKPVVQFAGPFKLDKGKTNKHSFVMPNYVGAVRVMVVAGENGAYGNNEKSVPVRKGLMLLSTLPRVLAPNEEVKLPVNIFVMKDNAKNVTVKVKTNDLLKISGQNKQTILFDELGEKMAYFNLKVNKQTGIANVEIEAKSGNEKATYEVELEVRNPNSMVTTEKSAVIEGGKSWKAELQPPGETGTNKAWIEVSGFPSLNLSKHLDYLIQYPHGCIEQITSAALPQLFIDKLTELTADEKLAIEDHIRLTLGKLPAYQLPNGGFGYWPGSSQVNEWGTNYAGHFILLAENAGYSVPLGLKEKWLTYQKSASRNWRPNDAYRNGVYYRNYDYTQSYRLYTLALAGSPDLGAMNRLREKSKKTPEITWRLAATYVLAGQKEAAEKMITQLSTEVKDYNEFGETFGSALRDKAMILEALVLLGQNENAFGMLKNMAEKMDKQSWLSTQTTAWCLSAAATFTEKYFKSDSDTDFELDVNGKKDNIRTKIPVVKIPVQPDRNGKLHVEYKNAGENTNFVKIVSRGIPDGIDTASISNNLILKTRYLNSGNQEIDPTLLQQGEDFKLEITVKHPGKRDNYKEMVLSTIFPSGWEIINKRLNDIPQTGNSSFEYQDIRDDRVYTYFDLNMNQQKKFIILLNATYAGKFYQAPISCEAMYDISVRSQKPGRMVEVK